MFWFVVLSRGQILCWCKLVEFSCAKSRNADLCYLGKWKSGWIGKVVEFFQRMEICICSIFPLWRWCYSSLLNCLLLFSLSVILPYTCHCVIHDQNNQTVLISSAASGPHWASRDCKQQYCLLWKAVFWKELELPSFNSRCLVNNR